MSTYSIKQYADSDFEMIKSWWSYYGDVLPTRDLLTPDTNFILFVDAVPTLSLSLFLTNCKGIAYIANFVSNPLTTSEQRLPASPVLFHYVYEVAKSMGFKRVQCLAPNKKLRDRYVECGMTPILSGLVSMTREI